MKSAFNTHTGEFVRLTHDGVDVDCDDLGTIREALQCALDLVQPSWIITGLALSDNTNSDSKQLTLNLSHRL